MMIKCILLPLFSLTLAGQALADCQLSGDYSGHAQSLSVGFSTLPAPVAIGEAFSLMLTACHDDGTPFTGEITASAVMPAHQHGMNYQPRVQRLALGQYRLDGYLFHMPGDWQFQFRMASGGRYETVTVDYPQ